MSGAFLRQSATIEMSNLEFIFPGSPSPKRKLPRPFDAPVVFLHRAPQEGQGQPGGAGLRKEAGEQTRTRS